MTAASNSNSGNDSGERTVVIGGDPETLKMEMEKAAQNPACLIIIRGAPQGHRFFLTTADLTLGRDPAADLTINDNGISRKHARVTTSSAPSGEQVFVTDLQSSNGTKVNGKRIEANQPVLLNKEDMIQMGNTVFKFLPRGALESKWLGDMGAKGLTDALTGIFNKGYLLEALDAEFKRAKSLQTELSVMFFDLDHFKKVNDTYGHDAGDYVLKEVTLLVHTHYVRPKKDTLARYGGEEFVMLLGQTKGEDAVKIGETIRAAIEAHPFIYDGKRLPVTSSVGVSELTAEMESAHTLLKKADEALYASKTAGRNRVTFGH